MESSWKTNIPDSNYLSIIKANSKHKMKFAIEVSKAIKYKVGKLENTAEVGSKANCMGSWNCTGIRLTIWE